MKGFRWMMFVTGAVVVSVSAPVGVSFAQEPVNDPLFSMKRVSVAFGAEREVLHAYPDLGDAWRAVLPVAYNLLSPQPGQAGVRFVLTARPSIAFSTNAQPELWLGARITLYRGGQ